MTGPPKGAAPAADNRERHWWGDRLQARSSASPKQTPQRTADRAATLDAPVIIAQFEKNARGEVIRVQLRSYKDRNLVDVRVWWGSDNGLKPSTKGLACGVRHLPKLAQALADAHAKAKELGLLDRDG